LCCVFSIWCIRISPWRRLLSVYFVTNMLRKLTIPRFPLAQSLRQRLLPAAPVIWRPASSSFAIANVCCRHFSAAAAAPKTDATPQKSEPKHIPGQFGRWVHTLFDAAKALNQLDVTANELRALSSTFEKRPKQTPVPDFVPQLKHSAAKMTALSRKFLDYLESKNKVSQLPQLYQAFLSVLADHRNVVPATVTVAAPLTENTRRELEDALRPYAGGADKQLLMDVQVDPSLIGGMTIRMKGRYLDMSLKTRIDKHKTSIAQGPTVKDKILREEEEKRIKAARAQQPPPSIPNIPIPKTPGGHH